MNLAIVIPTYNERETLPTLMARLIKVVSELTEKFFILIVDDGSPDGTGQLAEELNKKYGHITVLNRKSKLGLGSAYKDAFRTVLEKFNPDFIVEMDADHSHDPAEIPKMIQKIHGYDFIIASRHVPGSVIEGWGTYRKTVHSIAGALAALCGGIKISDPTSGFRVFKRDVLNSLDFSKIKSNGFAFQIEVLYYLNKLGYRGFEIPTRFVNRKEGKSKMGFRETIQFAKACIYLLMKRI
jgi:dolichol-phosphate mannosyltransferase